MASYEYKGARPSLGRGVFVADNATLIGDVTLGDEASVWYGCTLRGDVYPIRIGARTNIQDGTTVHVTSGLAATTLGDDVTVGHMALLHGCTVGNRVLVGMGSVLLDGSVVGDECLIGAGSLVTPRTVIPPRSFALGRPARVIRPLTDDDVAAIRASAAHYVELSASYMTAALQRLP